MSPRRPLGALPAGRLLRLLVRRRDMQRWGSGSDCRGGGKPSAGTQRLGSAGPSLCQPLPRRPVTRGPEPERQPRRGATRPTTAPALAGATYGVERSPAGGKVKCDRHRDLRDRNSGPPPIRLSGTRWYGIAHVASASEFWISFSVRPWPSFHTRRPLLEFPNITSAAWEGELNR